MILSRKTLLFPLLLLGLLVLFASCEDLLNAATGDEETAPDDPGNFVAVLASGNVIEMSWTDGSDNENGFIIEANTSGSIVWNQIADVGRNITSYAWHDAAENTTYTFRIYAYNDVDNSGFVQSTLISVPLAGPTNLSATISGSTVQMSWTDNSQVEEGFTIQRNATGSWEDVESIGANETSYQDVSAPAGTTVLYRVFAFGGGNTSTPSNEASVQTPDFLSAPSNLTATQGDGVIELNWTDNSSIETGFKIERNISGSIVWNEIGDVGANVTSFGDTEYPDDTDLNYRVCAYNNEGTSAYSNIAMIHSPAPSTTVVFEDDFESYPPETVPGSPWTVSTSDETWVYAFVDTATVEDNLALWFADDADAEYGYVDLDLPSVSEGVFELDMGVIHAYTVDGFGLMLGFTDQISASEEIGAYIEFIANDTNIQLYVHDGTDWVSYDFPADEWFHFAIAWNTSNGYRIFLNGSQLGGTYPFYNGNSGSAISSMSVALFNNLTLYWGLLDNVVMTEGIPNDFTASPIAAIGPVVSQSKVTARSLRLNSDVVAPSRSRNAESLSAR